MHKLSEIGGATEPAITFIRAPRHTELPQAEIRLSPIGRSPAANPLRDGLTKPDPRNQSAVAQSASDEGHYVAATQWTAALVGNLTMETRRYTDLRRAHQRLDLQAKAMARYACDGDKAAGAKLHAKAMKDPAHPLRVWLQPYLDAMVPLDGAIEQQAKLISDLAKGLPVSEWANAISGLSFRFLGLIVGECSAPVGEFRNPSCVWKRMGLAVIDGGRQRNVCGEKAIEHGYVARRRALMWNIGESLIKQQVRSEKDVDGKKIVGTDYAIGPYGEVYLERKRYEATKTDRPIIAHNRAKRYMEKRLLRELWKAWRAEA